MLGLPTSRQGSIAKPPLCHGYF